MKGSPGRPKGIKTLYGKRARALNRCYWCAEPSTGFYCNFHNERRKANDTNRKLIQKRFSI